MEAPKETILIIEDDAGLIELLSESIQESGFKTVSVSSANEALGWLKTNTPDLILLDYSLPDMTGEELILQLKNTSANVPPFVVSTGRGDERTAVEMMKLGARDYVVKDTHFLELIPIVVKRVCLEIENENKLKQAELSLIQSREEFKDLYDNAPIGYHEIDLDGRIMRMNQTELSMLGYTFEELKDQFIWGLVADKEFSINVTQEKLKHHQISKIPYEREFVRKDGSKIHVLVMDKLIESCDHKIIGIRSSIQDISDQKVAQLEVQQISKHYQAIIEKSPDGCVLIDGNGQFKYASPSALRMFGYSNDVLLSRQPNDITHPDDLPMVLENLGRLIHDPAFIPVLEYRFKHCNENWIWIESTFTNLLNNESVNAIVINFREISERKQTEETLKIRETYLTAIIENLPGIIWLKDTESHIQLTNTKFANTFGSDKPEDLLGKTDLDFSPKEHAERYLADDKKVATTKKPLHVEELIYDQNSTKWFETFKMPIFDENNKVIGTAGYAQDISERKISESILKQERELYLDLVNTQPAGIYRIRVSFVDKWTENAWSNSANSPYIVELASNRFCEILGVSRTEFENNPKLVGDLVHPDDQVEYEIRNKEANINQTPFNWDCRLLIKGVVKWVHFESIPRRLENGDLIFTGILYDINDRKLADEKLLKNKDLLKDLLHRNEEFIENTSEEIDFEKLSDEIKQISGAKFVSFNLYEPTGLDFRTVALVGVKDIYSRVIQLLGYDVKNRKWKFDPIREEKIKDKTITRFENMVELNGKVIPKPVSKLIQSTLGLGEIQIVNISKKNKRVGDFTLYFEKNTSLKNEEIVELFAGQVALYVDRKLAERKRDESKLRLKRAEIASKSGNWEFYLESNSMIGSEGAKKVYGLENVEFNYNVVKDIPLAEYRLMMDQALKNLIEKNEPYNIEFQIKTADNAEIKDIHSTAFFDNERNVVFGVIQDITDRKVVERKLQNNRDVLSKLLFASTEFIDSDSDVIDYKKISDNILEISGAKYCSFNILSQNQSSFRTMAISGIDSIQKTVKSIIGFDLLNKEWEFDPDKERKINHKIITKFDSLAELSGKVFPKQIVNLTTKMFDIGEVWIVQIKKKNIVIGDFTLLFSRNETLQNQEIVELFANQIALFIERKHIENDLQESEKKYKILFAENPQPMLVYNLKTLQILEINQTAIDFYGYTREDFLSLSIEALHPKEEIPEFLKSIEETRKGNFTDGISLHQKKNGEKVYVTISSAIAPVFGENARHVLIVDMTDRLLAESKLAESERFFRQSQEAAKIGSYNFNITTGLWSSSDVLDDIFGIDKQYVRSVQGWAELVVQEDREMMNEYFTNHVLGQKQPFNKEYRILRKSDAKEFWVLGLGELTIENNVVTAMIGTIQDITERKNAEIELVDKMRELQRFHKITVDRELMMITLKKEINDLLLKSGKEAKYRIVE